MSEMKDLIKKYRNDSLSRQELDESRDRAAMMDDRQLDEVIFEDWRETIGHDADAPATVQGYVKRRIDAGLGLHKRPWVSVWRVVRTACVIMLPLFVVATALLYFHEENLSADTVTVATRHGERSVVTLPDSSVITLNGATTLACCQRQFRGGERNIDFTGEAYFNVTKDAEHPFVVKSRGLTVTVLGTKFNLDARAGADCAVLYLEEGLVLFTSSLTGETVEVHPHEKAVLNYSDGRIDLMDCLSEGNILAWINGKLVFNDEPLSKVFEVMEKHYGYTLTADDGALLESRFTGTIPSDDMTMAVAVIEKAFGARFTLTRN